MCSLPILSVSHHVIYNVLYFNKIFGYKLQKMAELVYKFCTAAKGQKVSLMTCKNNDPKQYLTYLHI